MTPGEKTRVVAAYEDAARQADLEAELWRKVGNTGAKRACQAIAVRCRRLAKAGKDPLARRPFGKAKPATWRKVPARKLTKAIDALRVELERAAPRPTGLRP